MKGVNPDFQALVIITLHHWPPAAWNVEVYPASGTPATASQVGEIYHKGLTVANGSVPVWQSVITRCDTGSSSLTGNLWYSPASVTPVYDADGNLTDDGRWLYTWDAQNRLIRMETTTAATTAGHPYTKLTFRYDWQGRRLERAVWKGGTAASPTFSSRRRWLYDGWNPIAEFDSDEEGTTNTRLKTFTWGLDLTGTLQGAGGVGGLIVQTDVSGSVKRRASYDGNGNIVAWTRSNQSGPDYRCEYDAFGNTLVSEGTSPSEYGFSTKQQDAETGLYYYGYRYYDAVHGRWLNRDPIEEEGGVNLYGFIFNTGLNDFDYLGLWYADGKTYEDVKKDLEGSYSFYMDGKRGYEIARGEGFGVPHAVIDPAAKSHEQRHIESLKKSKEGISIPYKQIYKCDSHKYYIRNNHNGLERKELEEGRGAGFWPHKTYQMYSDSREEATEEMTQLNIEIKELEAAPDNKKGDTVKKRILLLQSYVKDKSMKLARGVIETPGWKSFKSEHVQEFKKAKERGEKLEWLDSKKIHPDLIDLIK